MNWKKLLNMVILSFVFVAVGLFVQSCSQKKALNPDQPSAPLIYRFTVVENSTPIPDATIIGIFDSDNDTILVCNEQGQVILNTERPLTAVCGASMGLSGVVGVSNDDGDILIAVEKVPAPPDSVSLPKVAATYWFGVYDTDSHGDVRFRYLYNFAYFYCSYWLPGWPFGDPNPNHWTSWNLTDFPYPWKGKKLLVPRTYQYWYRAVYGYSISRALFLIATS